MTFLLQRSPPPLSLQSAIGVLLGRGEVLAPKVVPEVQATRPEQVLLGSASAVPPEDGGHEFKRSNPAHGVIWHTVPLQRSACQLSSVQK